MYVQDSPCDEAQRGDTVRLNPAGGGRLGLVLIPVRGLQSSADYFRAACYRVTTEAEQIEPSYSRLMLLLTAGVNTQALRHTRQQMC